MVMRHLGGGIGHIDPVQNATSSQLVPDSSGSFCNIMQEEVDNSDSEECCSLPDEEDPSSETQAGNDSDSFEISSNDGMGSSSSDF
jgi:hypothetical protein